MKAKQAPPIGEQEASRPSFPLNDKQIKIDIKC